MEFAKFTGKTLEEALHLASEAKRVPEEELVYTVTEEKAGLFGLKKSVEIEAYCWKDVSDFIADYIQDYFDNAGLDGETEVRREDDNFYRVMVNTNSNALLIGKNGRTLQSFNRLVQAAASAAFKKRVRLLIDVNGYKEDRYEKVVRMARRVARDVRRSHVDAILPPMPADERKAVHNALGDMDYITTKSKGEGAGRQLQILYTPGKVSE